MEDDNQTEGQCTKSKETIKEEDVLNELDKETTLKVEPVQNPIVEEDKTLNQQPVTKSSEGYHTPETDQDITDEETEYSSGSGIWERADNRRWETNRGTHTIPQYMNRGWQTGMSVTSNLGIMEYLVNFENELAIDNEEEVVERTNDEPDPWRFEPDTDMVNFGAGGSGLQPPVSRPVYWTSSDEEPSELTTPTERKRKKVPLKVSEDFNSEDRGYSINHRESRDTNQHRQQISYGNNFSEELRTEEARKWKSKWRTYRFKGKRKNKRGGLRHRMKRVNGHRMKRAKENSQHSMHGAFSPADIRHMVTEQYRQERTQRNRVVDLTSVESSPGRGSPSPDSFKKLCMNWENINDPQESMTSSPSSSVYCRVWSPRQFPRPHDPSPSVEAEFSLDSPSVGEGPTRAFNYPSMEDGVTESSTNSSPDVFRRHQTYGHTSSAKECLPSPETLRYRENSRSPSYVPQSP